MKWLLFTALIVLGVDDPKAEPKARPRLDRSGAFTYVLPSGWQAKDLDQSNHDFLLSPSSNGEYNNIVINDQPGTESLEALKQEYERELPRILKDFQLLSSELVDVKGKGKAVRLIQTNTASGAPVRQVSYIVAIDDWRYSITFSTPQHEGDKYDEVFKAFVISMSKPKNRPAHGSAAKPDPIIAQEASFSEPTGWVRLTAKPSKTKGWFISPESDPKSPNQMIMIDIGKPTEATLQATAEGAARNWGGRVIDEKTSLDGVEAVRVRVDKPGQGLRPIEAVIAIRNGHLYMLMGGAMPGHSVADQVEEVRKGWKWVD